MLVIAALMANAAERLKRSRGLRREAELLAMEVQGYVRQFNGLLSVATGPFCKADEVQGAMCVTVLLDICAGKYLFGFPWQPFMSFVCVINCPFVCSWQSSMSLCAS